MSDVQITCIDDRFLFLEFGKIFNEIVFVFSSEWETFELFSGVRDVGAYKVEVLEFKGDDPSFFVVFVVEEAVMNA